MDARIVEAAGLVAAAKEALALVVGEVQASCPHREVYHRDGYVNWFRHPTVRVCVTCGLEEQAGPYDHAAYHFKALNTKFACTSEDPIQHRLPHGAGQILHVRYGDYYDPKKDRSED